MELKTQKFWKQLLRQLENEQIPRFYEKASTIPI